MTHAEACVVQGKNGTGSAEAVRENRNTLRKEAAVLDAAFSAGFANAAA